MNWPIFLYWMKINLLFICSTNMLVRQEPVMGSWARLLTVIWRTVLPLKNPKKCDPILVTLLKMRPHYSPSSRENATPSSGTSPLASYKEEPPPSRGRSTNSIAWKCWLLWNEWLLKWSKKRTILMRKKLRGLLEIWIGDRGSRIGFFNKNKINKSWIVVRMWAAD